MDIYRTVTDRILKQLEAGVLPWRKSWTLGLPRNLTTGKEYRGINILMLNSGGFASPFWLTHRQAQQLGGHVRKGERATPVVYWKWRTAEELKRIAEKTGKEDLAPCVPFNSAVFNLEQVEDVPLPDDADQPPVSRLEVGDQLLTVMPDKPEIVHASTSDPAYSPNQDRITLPHLSQFEGAEEYYATMFHELTHSTGHHKRLDRFRNVEGDRFARYSFEELVAEFGAAFLCAFAGIHHPISEDLQAGYIAGWAQVFQNDHRIIVRAASAAQRASDYIRGKLPIKDPADSLIATATTEIADAVSRCHPSELNPPPIY